uniref:RNA-directed DNA polymerase, eukaryota, reverse transcriptase zinc-binding domain protein n=1 Tax=Tanacetum cinerariifolium TaxID=118510 RepID=A0A699K3X5_TANCI|nr:RNA-directed DNA polymerase, eukaryota, reverse transcriptase zinc-binding domain protein [Tanacetum cinerariifolium]
MWNRLLEFIRNHDGNVFNAFIDDARLFEPVLGGRNSTWMSKAGTKMSKLDCFLISQHVTDVFSDVKVTALPRGWSDHTLIMLHYEKVDYGPVPFKLFHSWLQRDGFDDCVKMAYNECSTYYPLMPFHEKLKVIKQHIKNWTHVKNVEIDRKHEIISKISDIKAKIDSNTVSEVEKEDRMKLLKERYDFQQLEDMDVDCSSQKSPDTDGFSFLFLKSYWELLKEDVRNAVRCVLELFVIPRGVNSFFITLIPKIANPIHIKDFRPISLIGMQYKIIAKILANRLSKVIDKVVSQEQSAFIAGKQILDGPIVLSELTS